MNKSKVIAVGMSTIVFMALSSCSHSPTSPNQLSPNLIQNSSFQVNGQPSLQYWICDTSLATLVKDGPNDDSTWSLQLRFGQGREGYAQTWIPAEAGSGTYTLTAWVKSNNGWTGNIGIYKWSSQTDGWSTQKLVNGGLTQWSMLSVSVNLSLLRSDSIMVELITGATVGSPPPPDAEVLFTDIKLQKVQ